MRTFSRPLALILATTMLSITTPALSVAKEMPGSFADLVETLSPAVVNISTTQKVKSGVGIMGIPMDQLPNTPEFEPFREFFERFGGQGKEGDIPDREVTSLGSGFIIDAAGYIITNFHVIDEAEEVTVTLTDKLQLKAKIIGRDKKSDLALLKVEAKKPLPFVELGDSDSARVGDWVIAIGNPFGLGGSVTAGILSARQRSIHAGPYDDFLQTDASINRGNSGGPLFDVNGKVIGINSAIFSPSGGNIGIGFAVPSAVAKPVIEQLKQYGRTHRGWLGVKIQEVTPEIAESVGLAKPMGALVLEANPQSPGGKVGIKEGDIITQLNGKDITEMRFLPRMVAETKIGSTVPVTVWRGGKSQVFQVTIGEMKEEDEANAASGKSTLGDGKHSANSKALMGMHVSPITKELRGELGIPDEANGLVVTDVDTNSEAGKRGFKPGDVIAEANNTPIKSFEDLQKILDQARKAGRKYALLKILRDKDSAFVTVPVDEEKK